MTRPTWAGASTKDYHIPSGVWPESRSLQQPAPPNTHTDTHTHFYYKRSLNANSSKMVLWDTSPPSSRSAGFLNKVTIPCPNISSLNLWACCAVSSMSLELVTTLLKKEISLKPGSPYPKIQTRKQQMLGLPFWSSG